MLNFAGGMESKKVIFKEGAMSELRPSPSSPLV